MASGNDVQLVGFGTFSVTERAGREGRNPATGVTMTIPAKKVVKFKPGKALSDAAAAVKKTSATKSAKPKQTEKKEIIRLNAFRLEESGESSREKSYLGNVYE